MTSIRFDNEYRKLAKAANERMRQLERSGMKSAAYESAQSYLHALGYRPGKAGALRFSETGKADYNTAEGLKAFIRRFMRSETSTPAKLVKLQNRIWNTANKKYNLEALGVSREQYFNIWSNLPADKNDRIYGSDVYVQIIETYNKKADEEGLTEENRLSTKEIVDLIQKAESVKDAYSYAGLTYKDVKRLSKLGKL